MGFPVYSTPFLAGSIASVAQATALAYTVPAGKVAVIRSIDWFCSAVGVGLIGTDRPGFFVAISGTQGMASLDTRNWRGDQVVDAGHKIQAYWISGANLVHVSGFLLNTL